MRNLVMVVLILFIALPSKAQQKLSYSYDASGNRVSRTIVLNSKNTVANKAKATPEFYEETVAEKQVVIYPNPVRSELTISISGYDENIVGEYSLYNLNGSQIIRKKLVNGKTTVDMSWLKTGNYIMRIVINNELSSWKIIKE